MGNASRFLVGVACACALLVSCGPAGGNSDDDLVSNLPTTGQSTSYAVGDDGDLKAGIAWPAPRFSVSGSCVTDNLTGLMWVSSPDAATRTWSAALDHASTLSLDGHEDWRLPNINELESLVNAAAADAAVWLNGQGFSGIQSSRYWTSTTYFNDTSTAAIVYLYDGSIGSNAKTFGGNFTLPVRGTTAAPAPLPRTGWSTMSLAGDDGDLQAGVAWPAPRFTDHLDGTVTDSLTDLMWTKDGNAPGPVSCDPGVAKTWQEALDYVACLNVEAYLGHGDWRLPNRNELRSLVNYGVHSADWLNAQGFTNVQGLGYWTSTTCAYDDLTSNAWFVDLGTITVDYTGKGSTRPVWAVRSSE
jgi:hypothetical protein